MDKKIIRVFPRKNSYTPTDEYTFVGLPPMDELIPPHDEVHISCVFSWDKSVCRHLAHQWQARTPMPVLLGGPAYMSPAKDFIPGMYIKDNIVFTSRGCNNNCSFCIVRRLEGKLRELPIVTGNTIQDNNFLQCSQRHKDEVFDMLEGQRRIRFAGGLQIDLIDEHFLERAAAIRTQIERMFIACDSDSRIPIMREAVYKLRKAGFSREKIHCYALIGDDMRKNEARLRAIYEAGAMPRAQLFQPYADKKQEYSSEWKAFACQWQRPAATRSHMERGTNYDDITESCAPGQIGMRI